MTKSTTASVQRAQAAQQQELGGSLLRLGARLYRLQVEAQRSLSVPLSMRQFRILDRVDQGISSTTLLARLARRRASTVSKSADSLVQQELLTRKQAPGDRRTVMLALTPRGAAVLEEARAALEEVASWLVADLDGDVTNLLEFADSIYRRAESRLRADGEKDDQL